MNLPAEITVFITAMIPFLDLKLSIPLGRELGLPLYSTIAFSICGSLIPAVLNYYLLGPITKFAQNHSKFLNKFLKKIFKKTREKNHKKVEKYGPLFLILFVGIPIPGSGTVSGSTLAFLFGIPISKALPYLCIGALMSSLLVTAGVESIFAILAFFN